MSITSKKRTKGTYFPPGDKSISHRILILTGQAVGKSQISNLLELVLGCVEAGSACNFSLESA